MQQIKNKFRIFTEQTTSIMEQSKNISLSKYNAVLHGFAIMLKGLFNFCIMKRQIFILLTLLVSFSGFTQPQIINETGDDTQIYEHVFKLVASDLNLDTAGIQIVISDINTHDAYSGRAYAIMRRSNDSLFTIYMQQNHISKWKKIRIIIHEMKHISQMYNKRLVISGPTAWFEGTIYAGNVPYEERLYEQEAIQTAGKLYSKYRREF